MEKTIDVGEGTENVEESVVVKVFEKDILVSDISDSVKDVKDDGEVLVMVGAEIIDTLNGLSGEHRSGSGLVSIPTILEKELEQLLLDNNIGENKERREERLYTDRSVDEKAGLAQEVEELEGKQKTKTKADGEEEKSEKKEGDGGEKDEKEKEKKVKDSGESKKDKEDKKKDKEEKKKEKKEKKGKKSKKSDVERIQKKLEKIHAKIDRILAKKGEYLQRLAEAQEKDRQEKERLAAEEAAKQEQESATANKVCTEQSGDVFPEKGVRDGQEEAEVKQVEPTGQSSAKQPEEKNFNPSKKEVRDGQEEAEVKQVELTVQSSAKQPEEKDFTLSPTPDTDFSGKDVSLPGEGNQGEKVISDHLDEADAVKDS